MTEKDWAAILKAEDRIIANSDRRFRYHCYSLESMSEELTYQERSSYIQEDFTLQLFVEDFTDTIQNEKLVKGLIVQVSRKCWLTLKPDMSIWSR